MNTNGFYIELPADDDGNTALPTAVVEGRIVQGGTPEAGYCSNPARQAILFSAPDEIASRWHAMYIDSYGGYAEVEGPARMLSREEYDTIIKSIRQRKPSPSPAPDTSRG